MCQGVQAGCSRTKRLEPTLNKIQMKKLTMKGDKRPGTASKNLSGGFGLLLEFCTALSYIVVNFINDCIPYHIFSNRL